MYKYVYIFTTGISLHHKEHNLLTPESITKHSRMTSIDWIKIPCCK